MDEETRITVLRRLQDANIALTDVYFATDEFLSELRPLQTGILTLIERTQEMGANASREGEEHE